MSFIFHEQAGPFIELMFCHSLGILASDLVGNVVEIDRTGSYIGTGEYMDLQRIGETSAPVRRDISTTSQTRSYSEMSNFQERGVVCHCDVADKFPEGNKTFAGLDFQKFWASRVGLHFARRAKQQLYRVAKTAIEVADTTDGSTGSADIHISDQYSSTVNQTMTFTRLQDAKAKMQDAAGQLTCCVMHSTPWNNLVKDGISNYKIENVAGRILNSGMITDSGLRRLVRQSITQRIAHCESLGMTIIIDDDISSISMTGSTYTYKTKYETLLLGPGALVLSYQRGLDGAIYIDRDMTDARGVTTLMRSELDYCPHLRGIKWNSATTNPTDTQLGTKSNWSEVYTDHRQVRCVKLITNG